MSLRARAVLVLLLSLPSLPSSIPVLSEYASQAHAERDCQTMNNLDERAQSLIGRCCKGSVNREFPTQWMSKTLGEIQKAADKGEWDARKSWKLLNRDDYRK